jgi:dTDP-N-acetylfucosamine:lipid II N-acetylfucosaminyltransferase
MNLHILPDSKFSNSFYHNLLETRSESNNICIVRSNLAELKYVDARLPFAALYSNRFEQLVGDTEKYETVFIHQFYPLMYKWIAKHKFRNLQWIVWGTDLYNLPFIDYQFYGKATEKYLKSSVFRSDLLYLLKFYLTNRYFKKSAYQKVNEVLTWMQSEYEFACTHLPLKAGHRFFFYENDVPYHKLPRNIKPSEPKGKLRLLLGNSGTPTNNHIDAIRVLAQKKELDADIFIPLSYGDQNYIKFLKKNIPEYSHGKIHFIEQYMKFSDYADMLGSMDALIMNNIRPQGYGNVFMMMYLGKPIFMNAENLSVPDLRTLGFKVHTIEDLGHSSVKPVYSNADVIDSVFSHDRLLREYRDLFS